MQNCGSGSLVIEPASYSEWFVDDSFWKAFFVYMFCLDEEKTALLKRGCWEVRDHPFCHNNEMVHIVDYLRSYWMKLDERNCIDKDSKFRKEALTNTNDSYDYSSRDRCNVHSLRSDIEPEEDKPWSNDPIGGLKTGRLKALDMCCGVGRHSLVLARLGFDVTAVDTSDFLLNIGRSERSSFSASSSSCSLPASSSSSSSTPSAGEGLVGGIEWLNEDMRSFIRPEAYDVAVQMYSSFGYFEDPDDDLRVLKNIYASLKQDGMLPMNSSRCCFFFFFFFFLNYI
jgi:hypothetical protein